MCNYECLRVNNVECEVKQISAAEFVDQVSFPLDLRILLGMCFGVKLISHFMLERLEKSPVTLPMLVTNGFTLWDDV